VSVEVVSIEIESTIVESTTTSVESTPVSVVSTLVLQDVTNSVAMNANAKNTFFIFCLFYVCLI
jgi:hypothetical protein